MSFIRCGQCLAPPVHVSRSDFFSVFFFSSSLNFMRISFCMIPIPFSSWFLPRIRSTARVSLTGGSRVRRTLARCPCLCFPRPWKRVYVELFFWPFQPPEQMCCFQLFPLTLHRFLCSSPTVFFFFFFVDNIGLRFYLRTNFRFGSFL